MKGTVLLMAIFLVAGLCPASAGESADTAWFDLENCIFCKNLTENPDLLDNMTWKDYDITNGIVTITTVGPEYKEAYLTAQSKMEEIGRKMGTGQIDYSTAKMCGHCQAYGRLMQLGVTFDHVPTDVADILIMTSPKPEVVAEIKSFAKKNEEAMAKMHANEKRTDLE
ncbi:MAG: hypothetical protein P8181_13945 [bacterium]